MTKGKKKSQTVAVRQRRGRATKNQKSTISFGAHTASDVKHVCALADPFSDCAKGSKLPDDDNTPSIAMQIRDHTVISSDANGRGGCTIRANPSAAFTPASTITTTQVSVWGSDEGLTDYTAIAAGSSKYRLVSWGVRIFSELAPTNQSGAFRVITTPTNVSGAAFTYSSSFFEEVKMFPTATDPVYWTSKTVGNQYREYIDLTSRADWEQVTIVAYGLPASTSNCFVVEVVYNFEIQPSLGQLTGSLATPAADHKPHVLQAAGQLIKKHVGATVERHAPGVLANLARGALNFVSNRTLGFPLLAPPRQTPLRTYPMIEN
jgi:hypothetical protein